MYGRKMKNNAWEQRFIHRGKRLRKEAQYGKLKPDTGNSSSCIAECGKIGTGGKPPRF